MKWLALLPSENYRLDFGWWDKRFDDLLSSTLAHFSTTSSPAAQLDREVAPCDSLKIPSLASASGPSAASCRRS